MPTAQDPAAAFSEKKRTGIYIARGAETLGPYSLAEAAALVVGGYLHADDFAAHNGDSAWVPLADLLPPALRERPAKVDPAPPPPPPRWRRLALAVVLLAAVPLLVAGIVRWAENRRVNSQVVQALPSPTPLPAATPAATPVPAPPAEVVPPPAAETPTPPPPTPEPGGPLRGSLAVPVAEVRIAAYPLEPLENSLAPTLSAAQAAHARLDPSVDAAAAELATRTAEEQAALRALNDAAPSDPLRRSLRFAYNGAKTATRTAADNHRFALNERAAATGGEVFFHALPAPAVTAETDAAGTFVLDLPADGQPYIVAASVPTSDGSTRRWLVRLSPAQRSGHAPLRLDDSNTLTSGSEDSLVHATD